LRNAVLVTCLLVLPLALFGPAAAVRSEALRSTTLDVAVGPDGLEGSSDPYYLRVVVSDPEPPRGGDPTADDCAYGARPSGLGDYEASLLAGLAPIVADPQGFHTFAPLFPTCVATPGSCPVGLCPYASYNVATGQYYVETFDPGAALVLDLPGHHAVHTGDGKVTGTTGVGVMADCVECPPPACCG
jgi:hypothetical protein